MSKRIAILATVPDDLDPSRVLEEMTSTFSKRYDLDEEDSDVAVVDPYVEPRADTRPIVSTRDGQVRTGCTNNTVTDLVEIIEGYVADGYPLDDLMIEGITE